LFSSLNFL